jgi:hypothetical protein
MELILGRTIKSRNVDTLKDLVKENFLFIQYFSLIRKFCNNNKSRLLEKDEFDA